ncbi:hypothetical protein J4558_25460 [Leptolyngbya sp. 15MV]|nr:hypothetical protein J4558_25460 [Leptolyngbya sp. 15MV]
MSDLAHLNRFLFSWELPKGSSHLLNMRYISFLFLMVLIAGITVAQDRTTVKLKGQVVCSVCWFEAPDRKKTKYGNAADIQCAVDCSEEGVPQALAVEDEKGFTLYELEPGAFKPNGKDFLDLVPKFVEVEGTVRIAKDKRILSVNSLKILDETPAKPIPVSAGRSLTA